MGLALSKGFDEERLNTSLFVTCSLQSEATSLLLTCPILPALHLAATTAYNAPTTLTFLPDNRCHVTVNLHCTYVTFYQHHCPWSQVINTGRDNWTLIGETIDQSPKKIVSEWFDDPSLIDKQAYRKRETIAIWPRPFIIIVIGGSWRPVLPGESLSMMGLWNKIHLFLCFRGMASLHSKLYFTLYCRGVLF